MSDPKIVHSCRRLVADGYEVLGFVVRDQRGRMGLAWEGGNEQQHMRWEDELHDVLDSPNLTSRLVTLRVAQ